MWLVAKNRARFAGLTILLLLTVSACAPVPPPADNQPRSPEAVTAWQSHEIQKSLDLLRDIAIDANASAPPVLSTDATRYVVKFHHTAIQLVHDRPQGWMASVTAGLQDLSQTLDAADYAVVGRYVALALGLLNGGAQ
jgi:hypothetical protein